MVELPAGVGPRDLEQRNHSRCKSDQTKLHFHCPFTRVRNGGTTSGRGPPRPGTAQPTWMQKRSDEASFSLPLYKSEKWWNYQRAWAPATWNSATNVDAK